MNMHSGQLFKIHAVHCEAFAVFIPEFQNGTEMAYYVLMCR